MEKYFNVNIEFNHDKLEKAILDASTHTKGYCCFVDSNLMVEAHKSSKNGVLNVLNNSLVNSCDGAYIAKFASYVYSNKFEVYRGPEFFEKFVYSPEIQCIVGNTIDVYQKIITKVAQSGSSANIHFISLPFVDLDEFDYAAIAEEINAIKPRFIWVSLGAPKQEIFMSRILPHINSGILLGVGAALNYFSGKIKAIPHWAKRYNLIWFYRILTEPEKQFFRVVNILRYYPRIFF